MTERMTRVTVSGKTYRACLDPMATAVPGEFGFPEPTATRRGRGVRWTYLLSDEHMADMLWHLELIGSTFVVGDDQETRAEGRAILKDAARLSEQADALRIHQPKTERKQATHEHRTDEP